MILVIFDAFRTSNYSLEEMLVKTRKIHTGLHKHHFYFYRPDFAMKRGHSACATTSLSTVKIACKFVML